jgi:hypothetical protein
LSHERNLNALILKICNQIILHAKQHINMANINEFPIALESQLREALRLCAAFRGSYLDYKEKADLHNKLVSSLRSAFIFAFH